GSPVQPRASTTPPRPARTTARLQPVGHRRPRSPSRRKPIERTQLRILTQLRKLTERTQLPKPTERTQLRKLRERTQYLPLAVLPRRPRLVQNHPQRAADRSGRQGTEDQGPRTKDQGRWPRPRRTRKRSPTSCRRCSTA